MIEYVLEELCFVDIPLTISLLPLARCSKLNVLHCFRGAKDVDCLSMFDREKARH